MIKSAITASEMIHELSFIQSRISGSVASARSPSTNTPSDGSAKMKSVSRTNPAASVTGLPFAAVGADAHRSNDVGRKEAQEEEPKSK